jgi:hypothetical protein
LFEKVVEFPGFRGDLPTTFDVIFEEFKGTGNMEIHLDRKLVDKRVSSPRCRRWGSRALVRQ